MGLKRRVRLLRDVKGKREFELENDGKAHLAEAGAERGLPLVNSLLGFWGKQVFK